MAQLVRGCCKLSEAALVLRRRGLASASTRQCPPCDVGEDFPKPPGAAKAIKECGLDFRKREVWPYDDSCGCQDPGPLSGCEDVGKPRAVCCRSVRQYGCRCEDEEPCEEEQEEMEVGEKECDLDFKKREVYPYDDSCGCKDPPPISSCAELGRGESPCFRSSKPLGCECGAYDKPVLQCDQAPPAQRKKKDCGDKRPGTKCL